MEENKKQGKVNIKVILYTFLIVIFAVGFIVCAYTMYRDYKIQKEAERQFQEMMNAASAATEAPTESETETETEVPTVFEELGVEEPELNLDWDALKEQNEDIYAWIYVPNTIINYPVLQHPTEHDYYLEYNLDHSKGRPGCIYSQRYNTTTFYDTNTVLYGHNMKNGTMFQNLHYYEEEEFFNENRYFYIYTPERILVYEVYATTEFSNEHILYKYDFNTDEGLFDFVEDLNEAEDDSSNNHVMKDIEITEDSKLLTLSTCIYGRSTERWLVIGVLVGEESLTQGLSSIESVTNLE